MTVIEMGTDLFLLAPSPPGLDMEFVEVGYVLRVRTPEERFASDEEMVYDIEILRVSDNNMERKIANPTH